MNRKFIWPATLIALAALLGLVACSAAPTASPTSQPEATAVATPTQASIPTLPPEPSAYPAPDAAVLPTVPLLTYPIPGQEAYLQPTGDGSALSSYPAPGSPYPYPVPGSLNPYPGPAQPTQAPAVPTVRVQPTLDIQKELHATDPTTVRLASGRIQLVEFFAFW
ncbi:MAG: hypothetical protein MUE67_09200 [Anaerolineales bacterium]|jgi:hypothetical protein|nr:hypothetical protein [Anaerolineales bacterium]